MAINIRSGFKRAWNAFFNKDPTVTWRDVGYANSYKPDRYRLSGGSEKSIVVAIENRIAMDAAAVDMKHVELDENGRYLREISSGLNNCLTLEANIDQSARDFLQDAVFSMLNEGCVCLVPIDTDDDPDETGSFQVLTMRVGKIIQWYPQHVRINAYNDTTGKHEDIPKPMSKRNVAIIENPMYAVMNSPNSTLRRLIRKLTMLDMIDERNNSGKLDMIIQVPYAARQGVRKERAKARREEIEEQLNGSKYGIAYMDVSERIVQLNRPLDNNLMSQVEYLTALLYSQLGITQSIMDGTADEKTMLNYYNRTIEPILSEIADELKRKFLTANARTRGQSVEFYRDPFKLVPVSDIAEIADKFTRNEIMTSNEIRQIIGMKPSDDPRADELRNKNLNQSDEELRQTTGEEDIQNEG